MKTSNLFSFNELRAQSKYVVLAASVLALVACGNSKENKSPMPQGPVVTDTAPNPGTPPNGNQVGDNDLQTSTPNSDLNNDNGQVLPSLPSAPAGRPAGRGGAPAHGSEGATEGDNSSVLRPPLQAPGQSDLVASSLQFDELVAVKTGGKSGELNYTSASADGLMEEFKSYNLKVGAKQQEMNQNLAKSIVSAKIRRANSTGDVFVDLIVDEFGKMQTYVIKANEDDDKMQLTHVKSTGDLEFQGGFLKCTDLDGGCENAYAKIKLEGAYARVIFRNSYSDAHFLVQKQVSNSNFDLWKSYINNTVEGSPLAQKIDYVQMASFEIVNGRAGMGAMMITQDLDMVGLSIPLLAPEKGTKLNVPVAKLSDISKNYDLAPLASTYTQRLSQALTDVRLINNNGKGQLKLQLKLSEQGQSSASIWLVLSSVKKSTMSIQDVRSFEAGVKAF